MAVMWNSIRADGTVNPATAHFAKPVIRGEKFVITNWFREHGSFKVPYSTRANNGVPAFTREGFWKCRLPEALYEDLLVFYRTHGGAVHAETSDAVGYVLRTQGGTSPANMIDLGDALKQKVFQGIRPILEGWAGKQLVPTFMYGIREYLKGATLDMHVDRVQTHLVSAIINVDQRVDTDWPLHIHDHFGRLHKVIMRPGDMLLYESARLKHGRPEPLNGDYFANVFAHTVPAGWAPASQA